MPDRSPLRHAPVLPAEVLRLLAPGPGARIVDGTVGGGGHAALLLAAAGSGGRLLGLDRDPVAVAAARETLAVFRGQAELASANFKEFGRVMTENGWPVADVIFFDIGVSSLQLNDPSRGFAFSTDGPLDMRMDPRAEVTAADLVNDLDPRRLAGILREFGEEWRADRIVRAIVQARKGGRIRRTAALADIVARAVPRGKRRIHPATRTFQALRIAVNGELENLTQALAAVPARLAPGGRLGVIAFHSLEDRIVKRFIRAQEGEGRLRAVTKKPVRPSEEEIRANPRCRSARFRVAEKPLPSGARPEGFRA